MASVKQGKIDMQGDGLEIVKSKVWEAYLQKTYAKTASLFSLGLICSVILGGATSEDPLREIAITYGTELGMAFQVCYLLPLRGYGLIAVNP